MLQGECLLLVEGEERPLRAWDSVHCPPWTKHVFVGSGDEPCVILCVGARNAGDGLVYPVLSVGAAPRSRCLCLVPLADRVPYCSRLASGTSAGAANVVLQPVRSAMPVSPFHTPLPEEIRGVHIAGPLMSLPGKFKRSTSRSSSDGLNTVEVDVKDESGNVELSQGRAPRSHGKDGAARAYFNAKHTASPRHPGGRLPDRPRRHVRGSDHRRRAPGARDPHERRLALAYERRARWLNPYYRAAWRYDVDVAVAAAKAGFDEIQFDYVRFPSDGDLSLIRYPGRHPSR